MDLLPSAEALQIIDAVSGFLTARVPLDRVRALRASRADEPPLDLDTWRGLADMGLFALGVAEGDGGAGYGHAEEMLVFRELGRHLTPGPALPTVLAVHLAVAAGRADLVEEISSGRAPVALAEPYRDAEATSFPRPAGRFLVTDLPGAAYVLVVAGSGFALLRAVDLPAPVPVLALEPAARVGLVEVGAPVEPVAAAELPDLWLRAVVLTAAISCGVAEAARDRSAEYAKTRTQFGQPIGVFQAVKHRCAEMATRCEAASALASYAALVLAEGRPDAAFQVSAAKLVATSAAIDNAADDVQNHGGMGFTDESGAHLYVRRARLLEQQFGGIPRHSTELLALPAPQ